MNDNNRMKKIIIAKEFFRLDSPISKGLISGLKRLCERNISLYVDDDNLIFDQSLQKIFSLEQISFKPLEKMKRKDIFYITPHQSSEKNIIMIDDKCGINNFNDAVEVFIKRLRSVSHRRKTKETDITVTLSLDGKGEGDINTGIGFFDHMLEQITRHGNIDLSVKVKGDLHIDEHHTVEDVGITLGEAINKALGSKKGIKRYGYFLPMDDTVAKCTIDLGGRSYLNFKVKFLREKVGDFPTELTNEFFKGMVSGMKANIYIRAKGKNDHHKIEAIFKAFAKALNEACRFDERNEGILPSTKGLL